MNKIQNNNILAFNHNKKADNLDSYFNEMYTLYHDAKTQLQSCCETANKSMDEKRISASSTQTWLKDLLRKIRKTSLAHFPDMVIDHTATHAFLNHLTQKKSSSIYTIFFGMKKMISHNNNQLVNALGCTLISDKFTLQYTDKKTGKKKKLKTKNKDCQHFAFYKIQEIAFTLDIFSSKKSYLFKSDQLESITQILTEQLDYEAVNTPMAGDLICYINDDGCVTHFGVLSDFDTVLSKQGKLKHIIAHPKNFVPRHYSTRYVLFRKEGASTLIENSWTLPDLSQITNS